ncbi:MAG: hypothetical protein HGA45_19145 [Chloroflexales bacterium]|nr:hypothetical protein [Chloroflexales bacterium]
MDSETVNRRLRRFLLALAGAICAGTIIELWLTEHTESPIQLLPFGLCALGLVVVAMALLRPARGALIALRGVMGLLALGSLLGVYQHIAHNLAFELEIRPGAAAADVWFEALRGASPLLAPGILALAALIAIAATYAHPALIEGAGG